jgi:hypothetical protein
MITIDDVKKERDRLDGVLSGAIENRDWLGCDIIEDEMMKLEQEIRDLEE